MDNQKLGKISMSKSGHPRARFNMSHDVNTTADFGSVQPAMCRMCVPGTKSKLQTRSLTRLAPMVAPAFGRVKLKLYHEFVALKDVFYSFDSVMSQTPQYSVSSDVTEFKTGIPSTYLSFLSWLCLIGSRVTIYQKNDADGIFKAGTSDQEAASAKSDADAIGLKPFNVDSLGFDGTHMVLSASRFGNATKLLIPLANQAESFDVGSLTNVAYQRDFGFVVSNNVVVNDPVYLESADLVWENSTGYTYAFRLSSVGKRLRKILIGCGYQLDLGATNRLVSLLPLFAFFKAYWNLFGLTQWQNYETTSLNKLLEFMKANGVSTLGDWNFNNESFGEQLTTLFFGFVKDLCTCFYTDSVDYVSSHIPSTAVSPRTEMSATFIDVNSADNMVADNITEVDSSGSADGTPYASVNAHAFIDKIEHGELDSEYLKRLYKWTNRNTIIGRRIGEILRAQGLGKFVDACKTDFIGFTEDYVEISDVISMADTDTNGNNTGRLLGEYGGRGLQLTQSKDFVYENDEFGYLVSLMVIVPESGYMQQCDPTIFALNKFALYNPEFDSLGFEASTKRVVQGACDWNFMRNANGTLDGTFGFVPRYFGFKFAHNINNGDITLRGSRDKYLPYTLDKFIDMGSPRVEPSGTVGAYRYERQLLPNDLPMAGNTYRYVGRYPFLGNFNRIFANDEDLILTNRMIHFGEGLLDWWFLNFHDNFLISSVFNLVQWAPMLAVEDSFETEDTEGHGDMSVHKA